MGTLMKIAEEAAATTVAAPQDIVMRAGEGPGAVQSNAGAMASSATQQTGGRDSYTVTVGNPTKGLS